MSGNVAPPGTSEAETKKYSPAGSVKTPHRRYTVRNTSKARALIEQDTDYFLVPTKRVPSHYVGGLGGEQGVG